jgi:hypothetical protein
VPGTPLKRARKAQAKPVNASPVTLVPTELNPSTWPAKTGTVTDPAVLLRHGLEPKTEAPAVAKVTFIPLKPPAPKELPGEGQLWCCWKAAQETSCPRWRTDSLAGLCCPTCGNIEVLRLDG